MMETPEVAIDTSVLVGLIDSQDTWHDAASALQHALKSVQARLVYFDCRPDKLFCQMCRPDPYYCEMCRPDPGVFVVVPSSYNEVYEEEMEEIINRRSMAKYFKRVYGAPKKKDDIVRKVIKINSLEPHGVVYIGDALSDYEAAKTNSVHFIARVIYDNHLFDNIDCLKVEDLNVLRKMIEAL